MSSGAKDIQLLELKDTILQLNKTISEQNSLILSLQKMLEERNASDTKKDQTIANLQAQLDYLKQKMFGDKQMNTKYQELSSLTRWIRLVLTSSSLVIQ